MKIYIERIPEEGLFLEGEESPVIIGIEGGRERFEENIRVQVRAFKVSDNLIVVGSLWTHVSLSCSCCLENFNGLIENKKFTYDCEILEQNVIDITEPIREDILMGLPLRPLCQENCKGLCPQCGQNLNLVQCRCIGPKKAEKSSPFNVLDDLL